MYESIAASLRKSLSKQVPNKIIGCQGLQHHSCLQPATLLKISSCSSAYCTISNSVSSVQQTTWQTSFSELQQGGRLLNNGVLLNCQYCKHHKGYSNNKVDPPSIPGTYYSSWFVVQLVSGLFLQYACKLPDTKF